ncbi:hypothetical protein QCA50_003909 [Cerrena zonata]|uniref:Uncharacterized protein n=1 Tax=Cerrena zonata TaxID=2478898 RepID=A0AAW0GMB6_9APHY
MDGWSAPGNWKDLSVGSVTATIRKYDDENTITVTVGPVNKKAVITDSKGYLNQKEVDGVQGLLYYKNINDINNGLFANYNEDRIVFYQKQWFATDFVSYFIPYESNTKSLGIPGTTEVEFENIVWSNT